MFKSMKNWITAIAVTSAVCTTGVQAEGEDTYEEGFTLPFDIAFGVDFASDYNWRGIEVVDDPVAQTWVDISKTVDGVFAEGDSLTIGFNWWGNYDFTDAGREDNYSEYDWTGYLSYTNGAVTVDAGVIYYYFPGLGGGDGADTTEIFLGVSYDCLLAPSVTVYYDVDDGAGFYVNAAIGHSFELTENLSLDVGGDIGWADEDLGEFYWGSEGSGFTGIHGFVGLSYTVNENFAIGCAYHGSMFIDEADDAADDGNDPDDFTWGVISASFSY